MKFDTILNLNTYEERRKKLKEFCKIIDDYIAKTSDFMVKAKLSILKNEIMLNEFSDEDLNDIYNYMMSSIKRIIDGKEISSSPQPSQGDTNNGNQTTNYDFNPYGFDYTSVEEEELIRAYVESDIPVFLHGLSGCGKSSRVKKIDPKCVIIYMASAKPETIAGKSAVIGGEVKDIPPEWYVKLCKLCEEDPDHDHILFFDELTNASPGLQSLAYNIILDKEVAGKWKLPNNCKIVAAGNEVEESLAANQVPEPLFRRFSHVYIKSTVEKWVLWASEEKIHPAVIAFIVSNGYDTDSNSVFRTPCDGKEPCVDPRKWEMASKLLYKTNNPQELLGILGRKITDMFIEFVRGEYITLKQVLEGKYDNDNSKIEPDKACRVIYALCGVDVDNVKVVIDFINNKLYPEHYELFKKIWTAGGKDKKRVNILQELELKKQMGDKADQVEDLNTGTNQRRAI